MAKRKKLTDDIDNLTPVDEGDVELTNNNESPDKVDQLVDAARHMVHLFELSHTITADVDYDRYPGLANVAKALRKF